ncbi:hypothetical protein J2857_004755 [Neorhizobium galegae]|uniref:hypothetical protein n=1 Tax=Neorhizobium galegae TaxID=399 RepID=UPI001AE4485B|nr:hypothetical protein [Neorhizobium galegae]MBP2561964.1 hypothetical protein [Neorhizobium galegae]
MDIGSDLPPDDVQALAPAGFTYGSTTALEPTSAFPVSDAVGLDRRKRSSSSGTSLERKPGFGESGKMMVAI